MVISNHNSFRVMFDTMSTFTPSDRGLTTYGNCREQVRSRSERWHACIGAYFSFFFLGQKTNSLPSPPLSPFLISSSLVSLPSSLSFFSPFLPRLFLEVGPLNTPRVSGEHCKLSQLGVGRSPSQQTIWCILESKSAALVAAVFVDSLRTNVIFCTKTSLISYGGSKSSPGGALWGVFLLGQSPPLPCGSRRLCAWIITLDVNITVRAILVQFSSEASELRSPPQCWNHGGESSRARVSFRPRNISPHLCMLFPKLPLFVVMLPTYN